MANYAVTVRNFFQQPTAPGIILLTSGIIAMIISNSPLSHYYFSFIHITTPINVLFLVNDILMAIFFFDVGLEIKQQLTTGHLAKPRQAILPVIAAIGGVIVPALIFLLINMHNPLAQHGWAIATATDIAFALGVILLLGKHIPSTLHVLLLSIAIIDDIIAIIIIAIFYSNHISYLYLGLIVLCLALLIILNLSNSKNLVHYLMVGSLLWLCTFGAGIHPAISGVFAALALPISLRQHMHKQLFVWVSFFILPIFAFTNAGIQLDAIALDQLLDPVTVGVALGLIFGKQIGIFSFAWLGIKTKIAALPKEISYLQFYGMAILCGIGFTMSIFISNLAYDANNSDYAMLSKVGILLGSTVTALLGYVFLRYAAKDQ